jgi:hypothetical protein
MLYGIGKMEKQGSSRNGSAFSILVSPIRIAGWNVE